MVIAVKMFTYMVGNAGLSQYLADSIVSADLFPWLVIIIMNVILLVLGCFVDAFALMLLTTPFFIPIVSSLGFSLIWFGIVISINIEIGLLTPPIGLNLFISGAIFKVRLGDLVRAMSPFFILLFLFLALIVAVPPLSTWLPNTMFR
jgi:TRAP-type C4-dicarboxylate transport system permease large subunit